MSSLLFYISTLWFFCLGLIDLFSDHKIYGLLYLILGAVLRIGNILQEEQEEE